MVEALRFFYHSFPRPRRDESYEDTTARGWALLNLIREIGLVLAPEIVEWHTPGQNTLGTPNPIRVLQRRICFTELPPQELSRHSECFGPFALEFEAAELRRMGALPVIYMPQALSDQDHLALLGPFIVGHLDQIRGLLDKLIQLEQLSDPEYVQNHFGKPVVDNHQLNLRNTDKSDSIVQEFPVSSEIIRNILSYLQFETAPFAAMKGVTSMTQSLFYPTDDDYHDEELGYYRQREWRITGDYYINGNRRGRGPRDEEKTKLLGVDQSFWSRQVHSSHPTLRVEEALVLTQPTPDELPKMINRLIVPTNYFDQAHQLFGDRVVSSETFG